MTHTLETLIDTATRGERIINLWRQINGTHWAEIDEGYTRFKAKGPTFTAALLDAMRAAGIEP